MCEYYVKADPIKYEQRSRTIRIRGVLTTIRLENSFWDILAEMAEADNCTTNALITTFHEEILAHRGEIPNFASFLRVSCMRYMTRNMIDLEKKLEASQSASLGREAHPSEKLVNVANGTFDSNSKRSKDNVRLIKN
jgi:predicted DNA-binding ribbon-helix-helix protein